MNEREKTEQLLDEVLQFYANERIIIARPTIEWKETPHPGIPDTVAEVEPENRSLEALQESIYSLLGYETWKWYDLDISLDAYGEAQAVGKKLINAIPNEVPMQKNTNILIYPNFAKCSEKGRRTLIAHELWHLIEDDHGVIGTYPLITEGTATFASFAYMKYAPTPLEKCKDYMECSYWGVATLTHNLLQGSKTMFTDLLNPELRKKINDKTLAWLRPRIRNAIQTSMEKGQINLYEMAKETELANLKDNLTPENIISVYHALGMHKLAEELRSQDLTKLIQSYKQIGF